MTSLNDFWQDLTEAYPSSRVGKEPPRLWREILGDLDLNQLDKLLRHIVDHRETFPSLAHIRKAMQSIGVTSSREESEQAKHERRLRQIGVGYDNPFDSPEHKAQLTAAFEGVPDHLKMAKLLEITGLNDLDQVTRELPYDPNQREDGIETPEDRYHYDENKT